MNIDIYPFFLECSKHCDPKNQKFFQNLAFGKGCHIIKRKDKKILVFTNGEFIIPKEYSKNSQLELEKLIWSHSEFEELAIQIQNTRFSWSTIRKKDKTNLLFRYIASLNCSLKQKLNIVSIILLALFLKIINQNDISYDGEKVLFISDRLIQPNLNLLIIENEKKNKNFEDNFSEDN
jgi:hypothetical protein